MIFTTQRPVRFAVHTTIAPIAQTTAASTRKRWLYAVAAATVFFGNSFLPFSAQAQQVSKSIAVRIDSIFADYATPDAPGCALAVYKDGKIVYAKGYGSADLEHAIAITPQTRFDIGSTSKQFTASCILLLEQQGKLSLEDDIRKYIPEIPDYGQTITIRNMLNHTSGLRDYIGLLIMGGLNIDDVTTTKDALRVVSRQAGLDFPPGTTHEYSNTGYFLASVIVERVSGQSLRRFAAEHIFGPLGMRNTTYIDDHTEVVPNRAIGYSPDAEGIYHRNVSYWEQNGDGGVFTNVEDLLLWDENFYHPKVGGTALTQALQTRGVLTDGTTLDYALGLYFDTLGGLETVQHSGSWGGYRAELVRVPSQHISVAVLANQSMVNPRRLAQRVLGVLLADKFPVPLKPAKVEKTDSEAGTQQKEISIDPKIFDAYVGDYALDVQPDFVLTFMREGERYYSQATGQGTVEIFPSSDSTFFLKVVDGYITFHRAQDGTVPTMTLHQGNDYTAHRIERATMTPDQLTPYTGTYYNSELETGYTLSVEDGKLVARHNRFDPITLSPTAEDDFSGDQWYLDKVHFERGEDGSVQALIVSAGRVQGLRFVRKD